jgi:hypothetical protein
MCLSDAHRVVSEVDIAVIAWRRVSLECKHDGSLVVKLGYSQKNFGMLARFSNSK